MDPFTEKLLERTRARRENLQKKLSERPAAAAAAAAKRLREPLGETNSLLSRSAAEQVPQASTKPSPSKRKCSGENLHPAGGEENQQPAVVRPSLSLLSDRPTDKKPPVGPSGGRPSSSSSSSSSSAARAAVQPEAETMVTSVPAAPSREVQEEVQEDPAPSAAGMKSRLQRLAEQRRCWDGDAPPEAADDCPPLSVLSRPAEVPEVIAPHTASSEAPLGRRGRLAHLAATIGSWEDHLSPKVMAPGSPSEPPRGQSATNTVQQDVQLQTTNSPPSMDANSCSHLHTRENQCHPKTVCTSGGLFTQLVLTPPPAPRVISPSAHELVTNMEASVVARFQAPFPVLTNVGFSTFWHIVLWPFGFITNNSAPLWPFGFITNNRAPLWPFGFITNNSAPLWPFGFITNNSAPLWPFGFITNNSAPLWPFVCCCSGNT